MKNNFKVTDMMDDVIELNSVLTMADVRNVCVENDYYTLGDNDEYSNMLNYVKNVCGSKTHTVDIEHIAKDIFLHSDIDRLCIELKRTPQELYLDIVEQISDKVTLYYCVGYEF